MFGGWWITFHLVGTGESPSFASDGENPNKTLVAEKVALSTPVRSSPKVTGNHVLSSGNHSSLSQLLTFVSSVILLLWSGAFRVQIYINTHI